MIQSNTTGTSGTSEFDIKWAANGSSTYASIFSTTPKITSTTPNGSVFDSNGLFALPTGATAPVPSKITFNQGDKLRCDILQGMPNAADFTITIYYRAR